MNTNFLLLAVIGVFVLSLGILYHHQLKQKKENRTSERRWVSVLVIAGSAILGISVVLNFLQRPGEKSTGSLLLGPESYSTNAPKHTGTLSEAMSWYKKVVALWNDTLSGYDSVDVAMTYLDKSIEIYETARAYTARGQLKVQVNRMDRAMDDYDRAIQLDPAFGNAYFLRGTLYYIMGSTDLACKDWKAANSLDVVSAGNVLQSICH